MVEIQKPCALVSSAHDLVEGYEETVIYL